MPTYRVNTRVSEHWIRQYEIIADSPEKAAALVPIMVGMGAKLPVTGEEKVDEDFGDPDTFTVADAGPLREMEEAQRENDKRLQERYESISKFKPATGFHGIEIDLPDVIAPEYENTGGQVHARRRNKKRGR